MPRSPVTLSSPEQHPSASEDLQAHDRSQDGGLTAARGARKVDKLSGVNHQTRPVHGDEIVEACVLVLKADFSHLDSSAKRLAMNEATVPLGLDREQSL